MIVGLAERSPEERPDVLLGLAKSVERGVAAECVSSRHTQMSIFIEFGNPCCTLLSIVLVLAHNATQAKTEPRCNVMHILMQE